MIGLFTTQFDYSQFLKREGVKDPDDCMVWAFGADFKTMLLRHCNHRWNERHGEIFRIQDSDLFIPGIVKIAKAYLALPEKKV